MKRRILVVEDEVDLANILVDYLLSAGFEAQAVHDGLVARQVLRDTPPDLLLLDLMLPGVDGLTLLRELRSHSNLPVIMVTARVEEVDRLVGLESGADDYICKPFSPREVIARVRTVMRRTHPRDGSPPPASGLEIDTTGWCARVGGRRLDLTPREFELLHILSNHPGRVFSRAQLLDMLDTDNLEVSERAVDSHMKNLRRKLAQVLPDQELIRSVYGVGFVYDH